MCLTTAVFSVPGGNKSRSTGNNSCGPERCTVRREPVPEQVPAPNTHTSSTATTSVIPRIPPKPLCTRNTNIILSSTSNTKQHTVTNLCPPNTKHITDTKPHTSNTKPHTFANPPPTSPSSSKQLHVTPPSFFLLNINGINPGLKNQKWKLKAIEEQIKTSDSFVPFFALTETHLKSYNFDAEIKIPEYNIIRADRIRRIKGGTALYIHSKFTVSEQAVFSDSYCEAVMVFLPEPNLTIITVYRPPRCPEDNFTQCLTEVSNFIAKLENPEVLMVGDFNFPYISWKDGNMNTEQRLNIEVSSAEHFLNFTDEHFLFQVVEETTRDDKSTLDLIFTNNTEAIHGIRVEKTVASDHDLVYASLNYNNLDYAKQKTSCLPHDSAFDDMNFIKADWDNIREELAKAEWENFYFETDPEKLCNMLEDIVAETCQKHVPSNASGINRKSNIPRDRRSLLRKKKRLNSRINSIKFKLPITSKIKLEKLIEQKATIEINIRDSIKKERESNELKALERIKINSKAFFSYAKRTCKTRESVGPLKDKHGDLQNDPEIIANILQDQYSKVFSDPSAINVEESNSNTTEGPTIQDINITTDDIENAIGDMSYYSATGPDKFPASILKECKTQLSAPLQHLWSMSMETSTIPGKYLAQSIIPIYKKGDRSLPSNYRPVSLTSHIIKVFERVVRQNIIDHLEDNNLLISQQHGFRQKRNCLTQLIHHVEDILQALENDENADIIYLDFSKAFDKVDHKLLLHKMQKLGIRGKLLAWISSFLSNRQQRVVVKGCKSRPEGVISGVPQGTVLGPLLFIIYINDITDVVSNSWIKIFADDSKLHRNISKPEDRDKLQDDLHSVIEWAKNNNMELNETKFELIHYGIKEELKEDYTLPSGVRINSSSSVRDLGIIMNDQLTFSNHIYKMVKEAKKYAGWILRTFITRSKDAILLLYNSFVKSRLEYCCPLWLPYTKKDIMTIEAVQRSITAKINGLSDLNYWERLKALKLYSLQRRRERYCMVHVWKILNSVAPNDINMSFRHNPRLGPFAELPNLTSKRQRINTLRDKSFSCMGPRLFNLLPKEIKLLDTLPSFKYKLDKFLQSYPDTPPIPGYVASNGNSLTDWVASGSLYYRDSQTRGGATSLAMA